MAKCDCGHVPADHKEWTGCSDCPCMKYDGGEYPDYTSANPGENTRLQKWVDPAMFASEPMPTTGPRVYLLQAPPDPLGSIAACCKMYKGEVVRDLADVTDDERREYLAQLLKTRLDRKSG